MAHNLSIPIPLPIKTERLILRPFRRTDLDVFQAYRSDPLVAQYQGWNAPYAREQAEDFINEMVNLPRHISARWYQIALVRKADGVLIGDLACHLDQHDPLQAIIGYTLAREYWGNGYAAEAVRALLDFMFEKCNLHRVTAMCDVLNTASARLMERVGMRREGHFIENFYFKGAYSSEYLYAILAREWTAMKQNR
ncbi:MAG: GNAT family N-acetyltransferase [Anaerolineaceae bacterium]|nr:GNAT family N-acetyltransferase [Anaerolineaceae bacterium]